MANKYYIHMVDEDGDKARMSLFAAGGLGTMDLLLAALEGVTSCRMSREVAAIPITASPQVAIDGPWDAADKVVFEFELADARILPITIPDPLASIFAADDETVDPTNAFVLTLIAAVEGSLRARDGTDVPANSFRRGYRIRAQRKS